MKDYVEYLDIIEENKWVEILGNIHVFKKRDGGIAVIHPNIQHFETVNEWQSICYRIVNNVRIDGITYKNSNLSGLKIDLEKELNFLSSIFVPGRVGGV